MRLTSVWRCAVATSVAAAFAVLACGAIAAPVSLTLDPAQSSITLNGTFNNIPLSEQGPGSKTANYSGSIVLDVDNALAPTTLQILNSSLVAGISGAWLPEAGGGPAAGNPGTAADANYGLKLEGGALGNAYAAVRNLVFDMSSAASPVVGGAVPSTQNLAVTSGLFAVNLPPAFGEPPSQSDLTGDMLTNAAAAMTTYSVVGTTATLTIPIDIVDADDLTILYTGRLVATGVVPEPSSAIIAISLLGSIAALRIARRR